MKKLIILISIQFVVTAGAFGQNFEWGIATDGNSGTQAYGQSIACSDDGYVYVAGIFTGTVDFDPGVGVFSMTASSSSGFQFFVQKLDTNSNFIWAIAFGSSTCLTGFSDPPFNQNPVGSHCIDIATDVDALYCSFNLGSGLHDIDPGSGVVSASGGVLMKLNNNGIYQWHDEVLNRGSNATGNVVVDHSGNVITTIGGDHSYYSFCIHKFDNSGTILWSDTIMHVKGDYDGNGVLNSNDANAAGVSEFINFANVDLCVDELNNVILSGYVEGFASTPHLDTIDFDPGPGNAYLSKGLNLSTGEVMPEDFLLKLDSNGAFEWVYHSIWDNSYVYYTKVTTVGDFIYFNTNNNYNAKLHKFDASGALLWSTPSWGHAGVTGIPSRLITDSRGDLLMLTNSNNDLTKIDSSDNVLWNLGSVSIQDMAGDVASSNTGSVYVTGVFTGNVDFDRTDSVFNLNADYTESFVYKIGACDRYPPGGSFTNATCSSNCDGSATVAPYGDNPPYTYLWSDPSAQTTSTASGLCPGTYNCVVSGSTGCVQDVSVTVGAESPSVSTTTSSGQASCSGICDGTATVSASGTYPPFSYLWNDPSGQTSATATGLCAGWYSVSVTDANGCITVQDSVEVTNVVPTITTTVSSTTTQCGSCTGTATVSASGTYPPFSYLWNDPSGQTSATATGLCEQQYTVTVTDTYGCTMVSDSVVVGTNAYPAPSICLISVDSSSTKNLIAWEKPITNGIDSFRVYRELVGTYIHVGSVPYDSLSQFMDDSPGINPNATSYRYKLSIVDTCGLESSLGAYHETIHLTTNVGVGGEVNLVWDDYEGFSFGYYRILRDSTFTNTWQVLDSVSFTNFTYTDLTPPSVNAAYAVEVLPPSTCTSTKAVNHNSSRSNKGTILGGMAPQSDFNSDLTLVTEGGNVNFFDQSLNVPTAWNWTFTGGTPSSSGAQNPTGIVYDTPGLYDVQLIAINSNGSDTLIKTDYIEVVPAGGSAPACDFVADFTQITEGGSVNFLDQTLNTPTGWTWLFTGGAPGFSTVQNPTGIVYSSPGSYDVKLIASNANGSDTLVKTDYIEVLPATSIQELVEQSVSLYPNPTNDRVTIELSELALPCYLEIKDINGRLIRSERLTGTRSSADLSGLEGSVYLFRLYNSDFTHTAKVVKQ